MPAPQRFFLGGRRTSLAENRIVIEFTERYDTPNTTVQSIIVRVEADAERAQSIL
jgi:hypothetical protein